MINLSPYLMIGNISTESLEELRNTRVMPEFEFINSACHTRIVERIVKLGTGSSRKSMRKRKRRRFYEGDVVLKISNAVI